MKREKECRFRGEVREVSDEGIAEAYLTAWDTVDSYNSTFRRGAFKRTFKNNLPNMRLLWNHETLAGKILEAREDETGAFVRVKFNLDTQAGRDAYNHLKHGDVRCFSFGFYSVKDRITNGVREIQEVDCVECGPVIFEANHDAKVVDVRADDFGDTIEQMEKGRRGYMLIDALLWTLDDIFWDNDKSEWKAKCDKAIADFHSDYIRWIEDITSEERCRIPTRNELQAAFHEYRKDKSLEQIAMESPFTLSELRQLARGDLVPLKKREHLTELSEKIREAHNRERHARIETFCDELRSGGIYEAEKYRFRALLGKPFEDLILEDMKRFRN